MPLPEPFQVDAKTGLSLLTVSNPSICLNNPITRDQLASFLVAANVYYDLIVLIGAAVLDDPDVVVLGSATDNVVLVAQSGVTRREDVATAMRLLKPVSRKLKAAVLTPGSDVSASNG